MKESIYTIPITEVFEPECGCPVCALRAALETRWVEYITGAAMMEPDVRIKTNEQGFCAEHFALMLGQRNRLSVALLLQTRLMHIAETPGHKPAPANSCFVCGMIDSELNRILDNLLAIWLRDTEFKAMFARQEFLCYPHYAQLAAAGEKKLRGKHKKQFLQAAQALTQNALLPLKSDIDAFCTLYDYRNAGTAQPEVAVATAVERSIAYLTSQQKPT